MKSPAPTDISASRPEDGRFVGLLESTPGAEKHRDLCLKFWDGGVGASDDWMAWAHAACTKAGIPQGRIGSRLAALVDWVDGAKSEAEKADAAWKENAEYLLASCPHTIRAREGGGPEVLLHSLVLTFMSMQRQLAAKEEKAHG